jgi:hypothetical protein
MAANSKKKLRTLFYLLILSVFVLNGEMVLAQSPEVDLTEEERAWLKEHPEITIAHSFDWPPYSFLDSNNKPVGPSIEFFEMVAQMTGLKFKVHPDGLWNRIYEAGKASKLTLLRQWQ